MPAIAVVDDRAEDRVRTARVIKSTLKALGHKDNWEVIADGPPETPEDILSWLDENHATVLVADWKLNEGAADKRVADYEADTLIETIRTNRPSFPIFIITGFKVQAEAHLGEVESICTRTEFTDGAKALVQQIVRAGQRRHDEFGKLWSDFDALARREAIGEATKAEKQKLSELRGILHAETPGIVELESVVTQLEDFKKKAEAIRKKLEKKR